MRGIAVHGRYQNQVLFDVKLMRGVGQILTLAFIAWP